MEKEFASVTGYQYVSMYASEMLLLTATIEESSQGVLVPYSGRYQDSTLVIELEKVPQCREQRWHRVNIIRLTTC